MNSFVNGNSYFTRPTSNTRKGEPPMESVGKEAVVLENDGAITLPFQITHGERVCLEDWIIDADDYTVDVAGYCYINKERRHVQLSIDGTRPLIDWTGASVGMVSDLLTIYADATRQGYLAFYRKHSDGSREEVVLHELQGFHGSHHEEEDYEHGGSG